MRGDLQPGGCEFENDDVLNSHQRSGCCTELAPFPTSVKTIGGPNLLTNLANGNKFENAVRHKEKWNLEAIVLLKILKLPNFLKLPQLKTALAKLP